MEINQYLEGSLTKWLYSRKKVVSPLSEYMTSLAMDFDQVFNIEFFKINIHREANYNSYILNGN